MAKYWVSASMYELSMMNYGFSASMLQQRRIVMYQRQRRSRYQRQCGSSDEIWGFSANVGAVVTNYDISVSTNAY